MQRNKFYVPKNESARAYEAHKTLLPSNFRFECDIQDDEEGDDIYYGYIY